MITLAGRPNVGKSTLLNAIVGEKVAIVTPKPQTTRNRICGIRNRGETQFIFLDTPGLHRAKTRLGDYMVSVVRASIADVDAVAILAEPRPVIGDPEQQLMDRVREAKLPAVLVINKIDTVPKEDLLAVIDVYRQAMDFQAIVPISAKQNEGVEELLDVLETFAQEGPALFTDDMTTDQPERQIVAELVREKLLLYLQQEVPHGTAVEVTRFTERNDGIIDLYVTIYCEKESHKGIIIGKKGETVKKIASAARQEIERFMGAKVYMETVVKIRENWRDNQNYIRGFGYTE
ncbi:MAG: GTPase Era [Oscillospiraceae bacterium]|nr:GTPase Era [Oscillospiraceae bacterium]